ncbi:hypothetical protein [Stutzerimonas tarimensis]|uniref:VOC family protein n=1 Tax=Stutzerimonas tarimensis TaxID=1507735 RepID=A0ABV7T1N3_9GAMM
MRQPDIEIYLKDASLEAVGDWLAQRLGACTAWQSRGQTQQCRAGGIPVVWLPRAVGKWHSLLLESDTTPWIDDLACARDAHAALGVEIRCAPGGWQEEESDEKGDHWLSIDAEGEREILWRTD